MSEKNGDRSPAPGKTDKTGTTEGTGQTEETRESGGQSAASAGQQAGAGRTDAASEARAPETPAPPPPPSLEEGEAGPPRGFAGALALVLVILLLVLGAGAAYWFQERLSRLEASQAEAVSEQVLSERSAALEERIAELGGRISNLNERVDSRLQGLAELEARIGNEAESRQALADRVDQLFRRMESSRSDWRHAEAAYLAGVADYRARLLGDVDGALEALEAADQLLAGLGGEGVDARQAIAEAIDQLLAAEEPDLAAVSDGLTAVSSRLADLPLGADVDRFASEPPPEDEATPQAPAGDGWRERLRRAWTELREGLSGLVTVSRDRRVEPLPTPEARFLLQQNLSLQLESARLAALRGNPEPYRGALERVDRWVAAYFDTGDESVAAVREEIARLREISVSADIPDIRDTLAPVRNWE